MPDFLFGVLLLGPLLLPLLATLYDLRRGSYLRQSTKSKRVFLAPVGLVVAPTTVLVWMFWCMSPINLNYLWLNWRSIPSDPETMRMLIISGFLIAGFYWAVIRWYQKKCPLVLDIERRSYRIPDFSTMSLKVQTGSWEEIKGISVRRTDARGAIIFQVKLEWQRPHQSTSLMGGFSKREKAEAFAERMARETGLPVVASPF